MRLFIFALLFVFTVFFFTRRTIAQETTNDIELYDDGGASSRKNTIYFDLGNLHNPFYTIGYQRDINNGFYLTGGLIFLQNGKEYKIPITGFELKEDDRFIKDNGKLNFFTNANFCFQHNRKDWKRINSWSFGYQLIHYDLVNTHDIVAGKSLFGIEYKNRILFSISIAVGLRIVALKYPHFSHSERKYIKSFSTFYYHLPIIVGYKF